MSHSHKHHHDHHDHHGHHGHCHEEEKCRCPIEQKKEMLEAAFCEALKQAHVCALKKKIEERFADKIDKSTDIILEAMKTQWDAKLSCAKAKHDSLDKLAEMML